jgi:competence protein ComEC
MVKVGVMVAGLIMMYKFIDKQRMIEVITQGLPPKEAAVLAGIIWGEKGEFGGRLLVNLKNSGLIHLMVASGTNLLLISRFMVEGTAGWWGRKKSIIFGLTSAWGYSGLVGWEPPIVRSWLFLAVYYWAQLIGRKFNTFRSLGLVVLMMVLGDSQILGKVSFWLSLAAFWGVITISKLRIKPLGVSYHLPHDRGWMNSWVRGLISNLIKTGVETGWISLWVTPILAFSFGKICLISPLSNILILGIMEMVTVVGVVGSLVGLIVPMGGRIILMMIYPLLRYLVWVVENLGGGLGVVEWQFNIWMLAGWYLVLGGWMWNFGNGRIWESARTKRGSVGADPCICPNGREGDLGNGRIWESARTEKYGK